MYVSNSGTTSPHLIVVPATMFPETANWLGSTDE